MKVILFLSDYPKIYKHESNVLYGLQEIQEDIGMVNNISELHLVIVYIGKELSSPMIIDSVEIVSMKLQVVGFLGNKSDKHKKANCYFVLLLNPYNQLFFSVVGRFAPRGYIFFPSLWSFYSRLS